MDLRITEIFFSLQGESITVGVPTVFIRLTGCPLRCQYCDTSYAFSGGEKLSFQQILEEVAKYKCKYVTVTGGEPLAQKNCHTLLTKLCDLGYIVSLETSGAITTAMVDQRVIKVIDFKTPGSLAEQHNDYANIRYINSGDQIKIVICDYQDYLWAKQLIAEYELLTKCTVLLSPSYMQQPPQQLAEWILQDRLPIRFQLQLHKYLWQDQPGK